MHGHGFFLDEPDTVIENLIVRDARGSGVSCTGSQCRITDSWLDQNGLQGLECDLLCEAIHTRAGFNGGHGIQTGASSRVRGCLLFLNGADGIQLGANSVVEGTSSRNNTGNEIAVGANSLVLHNVVEGAVVGGTRIENVCNPACP